MEQISTVHIRWKHGLTNLLASFLDYLRVKAVYMAATRRHTFGIYVL